MYSSPFIVGFFFILNTDTTTAGSDLQLQLQTVMQVPTTLDSPNSTLFFNIF